MICIKQELLDKKHHYNNIFELATLRMMNDRSISVNTAFPFHIKVNGSSYHALSPIYANSRNILHFIQLYMIDDHDMQLDACTCATGFNDESNKGVVSTIQG